MLVATMTPLVVVKVFFPDLFEAWFGQGWYGTASMFLVIILAGVGDFNKVKDIWDFDIISIDELRIMRLKYKELYPYTGITLDKHIALISMNSKITTKTATSRLAKILTSEDYYAKKIILGIEKYKTLNGIEDFIYRICDNLDDGTSLKGHAAVFDVLDDIETNMGGKIEQISCKIGYYDEALDDQFIIGEIDVVYRNVDGDLINCEVKNMKRLRDIRERLESQLPKIVGQNPERKIRIFIPADKVDELKARFGLVASETIPEEIELSYYAMYLDGEGIYPILTKGG